MDENVAKGNDLWQRHFGVAVLQILRKTCRSFANNAQLLHDGAAQQLGFLKSSKSTLVRNSAM